MPTMPCWDCCGKCITLQFVELTNASANHCKVLQTCLDVRHLEEGFEVAGVHPGSILVAPRTILKDLGGARPDILVTLFFQGSFKCVARHLLP